jgi:hypothetical protein
MAWAAKAAMAMAAVKARPGASLPAAALSDAGDIASPEFSSF